MKRILTGILIIAITLTPSVVRAVDGAATLTDDQVEYIRNNCTDTQTVLRSLHSTDAVARINLGQQYEAVSTRLMAPMNSRIALNKLDGVELAKTTLAYNDEFDHFRKNAYPTYEKTVSSAISLACYDQPIEFYDTLSDALDKRKQVRTSVDKLSKLLGQYHDQLADVEKQIATKGGQ